MTTTKRVMSLLLALALLLGAAPGFVVFPSANAAVTGAHTIYYYNGVSQWDQVYAHMWGDGDGNGTTWPGTPMTDEGNGWFSVSYNTDTYYKLIISENGGEYPADRTNGSDLDKIPDLIDAEKIYFFEDAYSNIGGDSNYYLGNILTGYDAYLRVNTDPDNVINVPGYTHDAPVPLTADEMYSIYAPQAQPGGDTEWRLTGIGGSWDPGAGVPFEHVVDDFYIKKITMSAASHNFKVTKDGKWDGAIGKDLNTAEGSSNITLTLAEETEVIFYLNCSDDANPVLRSNLETFDGIVQYEKTNDDLATWPRLVGDLPFTDWGPGASCPYFVDYKFDGTDYRLLRTVAAGDYICKVVFGGWSGTNFGNGGSNLDVNLAEDSYVTFKATAPFTTNVSVLEYEAVSTVPPGSTREFKLHYYQYEPRNYTGWNLWMWAEQPTSTNGKQYNFSTTPDGGWITLTTEIPEDWTNVGMIVRKSVGGNDWSEQLPNLSTNLPKTGAAEFWYIHGETVVLTSQPSDSYLNERPIAAMADTKKDIIVSLNFNSGAADTYFRVYQNNVFQPSSTTLHLPGTQTIKIATITMQNDLDPQKLYEVRYSKSGDGDAFTNPAKYTKVDVTMREILNSYKTTATDLGLSYSALNSKFKVWSPTATKVELAIYNTVNYPGDFDANGKITNAKLTNPNDLYSMSRDVSDVSGASDASGVWSYTLNGNHAGKYYMYKITFPNGTVTYAIDPYVKATSANGWLGAIVNLAATNRVTPLNTAKADARNGGVKNDTDQTIYEVHVRDFTISPTSGVDANKRGTYLGFVQEGTTVNGSGAVSTGIDHLVEIGVTTVHLLPVFDIGSINELRSDLRSMDTTNQPSVAMNWGYDPQNYNVPEGSYSTDPKNPVTRINELKALVSALHDEGIRVVMDVVYNHTFSMEDGPFQKTVPGYYYRSWDNGIYSNGSGCGNETASERDMVRKYIIDSLLYWQSEFGIDGFRFDLMALHDTQTAYELVAALEAVNPNVIIYGEPWNAASTPLASNPNFDEVTKGTQQGHGFAYFNDDVRETIRGDHTSVSSDSASKLGGFAGNGSNNRGAEGIKNAIKGSYGPLSRASESITYTSKHDNLILFDMMQRAQNTNINSYHGETLRDPANPATMTPYANNPWVGLSASGSFTLAGMDASNSANALRSSLLAVGMVLTMQGIPFLQAGDEFVRTKRGNGNSYNANDYINALDWTDKIRFAEVNDYMAGLIQLRNEHPAFRMDSSAVINSKVTIIDNISENNKNDKSFVSFKLGENAGGDRWKNIYVAYNGTSANQTANFGVSGLTVVVNNTEVNLAGIGDPTASTTYTVPPFSMVVAYDEDDYYVPELTNIAIGPATIRVDEGKTVNLSLTYVDQKDNEITAAGWTIAWSSSDSSIAAVNPTTGVVTGVAAGGPVTITATATHATLGQLTATATITVAKQRYLWILYDSPSASLADVHVWDSGMGNGTNLVNTKFGDYKAAKIPVSADAERVGYIIRKVADDWDTKNSTNDQFVTLHSTGDTVVLVPVDGSADNGVGNNYRLPSGAMALNTAHLNFTIPSNTYNGSSQGIGSVAVKTDYSDYGGTLTVKYNGSTTAPTNAGTYSVTVESVNNPASPTTSIKYVKSTIELGTYVIAKKPLADGMISSIPGQEYTGSPITLTMSSHTTAETNLAASDYTVSYENNTAIGTAAVILTATAAGNYSGTARAEFQIIKNSTVPTATTPSNIMIKADRSGTFNLETIHLDTVGVGARSYTVTNYSDNDGILDAQPTISGSTLNFAGSATASSGEDDATVVITITTANYADCTVTLTFEVTANEIVTLGGISVSSKTFNGTAAVMSGDLTAMGESSNSVIDEITPAYLWSGTSFGSVPYIAGTTPPTNAGDYELTVTATGGAGLYIEPLIIPFSISKKTVTVTGVSHTISVGDPEPPYTSTISGEVAGFEISPPLVTSARCPAYVDEPGAYPIIPDRSANASGNYNIEYHNGTLTVNPVHSDVVTVTAPSGAVINSDSPPYSIDASVANGVSSVTVDLTVSPGASWNLYYDSACLFIVPDKLMDLNVGSNVAYIKVVNGAASKVYTLTITRASGGGTSPSSPSPSPTPDTISGHGGSDKDAINIPAAVNTETGEITIKLDEETTQTLIDSAITKAKEQDSGAQPTVTLDLSGVENATSAVLNVETSHAFSKAEVAVTIVLPSAEITLAPEALATLAAAHSVGTTPITVEAAVVPMGDLRGMQAAQVKGYQTVVNIDIFVGDTKVDVPLTVSLPYTLKPNENPAAVTIWHLDDNGNLTKLNGVYDKDTGMITFTITHQSYFVVGYDPVALWANIFNDVSGNAWYYDAVAFTNYYGLFTGDGKGSFMPQDSMTRAMFVTVLWNLEERPKSNGTSRFTDVSSGEWYYDAVVWAAENGVVNGVGGDKYAPNRAITRQEMAVMLMNYANLKSYDIPEHRAMPEFKDKNQIDTWAEEAARKLAESGVVNGSNGEFKPLSDATRAEAAQMFKNFMRLIIGNM